ncbi:MAG: ABC transporter permease [Polyangiaceae bacterium]
MTQRRQLLLVAALSGGLVLAVLPWLPMADPAATELSARLLRPGHGGHVLGTDALGRDMAARLLHALRLSLGVGALGVCAAAGVGSALGVSAAYFGGKVDAVLMRGVDVLLSFPYLLLALAIVAVLGPGLLNATLAIAVVNVPFFARTLRGVALSVMTEEYVSAARAMGGSSWRVITRHVLPSLYEPLVVASATAAGWVIVETAGLGFLGLGAQPPRADLGTMVGQSRHLLVVAPHATLLPAACLAAVVLLLNLAASALTRRRDRHVRSSPRLRNR